MRVSDFKKRPRRTTEKSFEDLFVEVLEEKHLYNRHMSDRFSGLPDRYIERGRWVEIKSLEYARGVVPYGAGLSKEQRIVCGELSEADEEVWYLALITTSFGQYVIFMPMHVALSEGYTDVSSDDLGFGLPYDGKETIRKIIPKDWYV